MIVVKDLIQRIHEHIAVPARNETVDVLIAGSMDAPVTGISTCIMATLELLQRSAAEGRNLVITHEPTFYFHQETRETPADDELSRYKQAFIQEKNLNIFRFHDGWHDRRPDGIAVGMTRALNWESFVDVSNPHRFRFSGEPLVDFARTLGSQLGIQTMRIVGSPDLPVRNVVACWGFLGREQGMQLLAIPGVDLLITGETHEWEVVEYAQDLVTMGKHKALIILGHMLSEQAGMAYCAEWLQSFIPEVPISFIPMAEPYWNPGA